MVSIILTEYYEENNFFENVKIHYIYQIHMKHPVYIHIKYKILVLSVQINYLLLIAIIVGEFFYFLYKSLRQVY